MNCYRVEPGAIVLAVRLTPGADRDSVEGVGVLADGKTVALARVRARPEDGEANRALIALLARTFRRPKSAVRVKSGATARIKELRIAGDPGDLAATIRAWPAKV